MTIALPLAVVTSLLALIAAQGAVIFATAYGLVRLAGKRMAISKRRAVLASYAFWVVVTLFGYIVLAGEMGLFDGFGAVLFLCITAFISASVYLRIWTKRTCSAG